jgi:predicted DNA-binding transcriptional regulator YafY
MKWDRLLGITMELLTKKRVTATELAGRFEVSIRTIYRDVELISRAGIPVASFLGTDGGFELMDGFFLTKQHFSVEDFLVIYHLLKGVEGNAGGKFTELMHKLGSLQPALMNLYHAINEARVIAFSYTSASGVCSDRQVEPINLYWERGIWYLEGYCLLRKALRVFRVSRISKLEVLESTFYPRKDSDHMAKEDMKGISVHLRFDLKAQPRVFEQFPAECTHLGTYIDVKTIFYAREYALSVILSFGPKVEIISPSDLRDKLMEQIKEIHRLYR